MRVSYSNIDRQCPFCDGGWGWLGYNTNDTLDGKKKTALRCFFSHRAHSAVSLVLGVEYVEYLSHGRDVAACTSFERRNDGTLLVVRPFLVLYVSLSVCVPCFFPEPRNLTL